MTPIEAYVLAKKIAISAVSGVNNLSVDGTKLIIETNDGNTLEMDFPIPDGVKTGYYDKNNDKFYINDNFTGELQGKDKLLYIDKGEGKLYHWNSEGDPKKFQLLAGGGGDVKYDKDDFDFDKESQTLSLKPSRRFFIGKQAEWNALTTEQKKKYSLVHILDDPASSGSGGSGGSAELTAGLTSKVNVGGIKNGKTYNEGTSLETLWRDLLDPVMYPTLTAPSATLSAAGTKLLEKGESKSIAFTITFNRGSINPAYGTSGKRAGAATEYTFEGTTNTTGNFTITVSEAGMGANGYKGTVAYAAGDQPKDSNGSDYSSPLVAGSVDTNAIKYEFVEALWANVSDITSIDKQTLVSKTAGQKVFNFPAQTENDPEIFDIPSAWNVTAIEVLNTLSNQWEEASSQFDVSTETHNDAGGNQISYNRYSCNLGFDMGARDVRVKWN